MNVWLWVLIGIVLAFGLVVLVGAPYLPTLNEQKRSALDMLDLQPGQTMLELGSGDGRMLKAAAERGLHVVGYELNPLLVIFSVLLTWKYKKQVRVVWGNYWHKDWPKAEGIYTFLLSKYMPKLDKKIIQEYGENVKLVSFAFEIPNRQPVRSEKGLFLYKY
jgi:SAM-dependent methyltransferase